MMKKSIALAILTFSLVFSWSCVIYSWKKTALHDLKPEKRAEVKISAVQVHSGEKTELQKKPAARIQGDSVAGARLVKNFVLEKSEIKHPVDFGTSAPAEIITKDGVTYTTDRILGQTPSSVTFDGYVAVSIPLADVDLVWIRKVNVLATLLLDIGPLLAFEIIEHITWSPRKE
jgi:hypothetical protein